MAERRGCMRVCKHGCVTQRCTNCKHAITRFSNISFDWSVEKCQCQINVVGRYVLISKMNSFIFSRVVAFRGSYFIKAIENFFPVFARAQADVNTRRVGEFSKVKQPSTSSLVCIIVSNSLNPSRVYVSLCKHGKSFLLLK